MLTLLAAFTLIPVLLPVLARWFGSRVFYAAAMLPLVAFVHTAVMGPSVLRGDVPFEIYRWIPSLGVSISMRMDTLSWVMALIVTGVGTLVLLYCRWYFRGYREGLGLFSGVLLGFAGAMYGLVLTDDFIMLVMFWEITSVLSYLLIGYYHRRAASRRAALQALLVTTLGGLVMLVGVVMLVVDAGTTSISEILAAHPTGPIVNAAIIMMLVGALSKSAIFPFQFWLPGAMAAPTPVSAYLHAAAMVKAGIYLIARLAPDFAGLDIWRPIVLSLGLFTMLLGAMQALRERDLKRILAYGTVSQLGLLTVMLGYGVREAALAGLALLVGHALFKSSLFLIVGIIDRQLSTRNIDELSGLGRRAPVLAISGFLAVGSMAGIAPSLGFVAKESAFAALWHEATHGSAWGMVTVIGVVAGSALTVAYGCRFLWGAFWRKPGVAEVSWPRPPFGFVAAPALLSALTLVGGLLAGVLDPVIARYADTAPAASAGIEPPAYAAHLALWHGFNPALWLSIGSILAGVAVFFVALVTRFSARGRVLPFTAIDVYNGVVRVIDRLSVWTTSLTQRGSLPVYVAIIFVVLVVGEGVALLALPEWRIELDAWHSPTQLLAAPLMIIAGILAVQAKKRFSAVALVSVTGLGMVVLFATSGAPDLALTQVLIETVTLVAFALVLRRLPARMESRTVSPSTIGRAILGAAVGVTMAAVAIVATSARQVLPISAEWPPMAYEIGHGKNVVNVALVDLRGWDTMGELSVLILAATGVASLVFVTNRADNLQRFAAALPDVPRRAHRRKPMVETESGVQMASKSTRGAPRAWLLGGPRVKPENRSIMTEVIVRILFHSIIIVSLYVLFAGHNLPGGGFAGGLIAGMALVMRYIAGGRYELGAAAPTDAGRLLGAGMLIAAGSAVAPMLFGLEPLTSALWEAEVPLLGHIYFVTSTVFDVGVYLVVIGLVLDVLRSLGAEVDRQAIEASERGSVVAP